MVRHVEFPPECLDLSEAMIEEAYNTVPIVLALDALHNNAIFLF